jgi:hypothetical protein
MKCHVAWQAWDFVALRFEVLPDSVIHPLAVTMGFATKLDVLNLLGRSVWSGKCGVWSVKWRV